MNNELILELAYYAGVNEIMTSIEVNPDDVNKDTFYQLYIDYVLERKTNHWQKLIEFLQTDPFKFDMTIANAYCKGKEAVLHRLIEAKSENIFDDNDDYESITGWLHQTSLGDYFRYQEEIQGYGS